MTRGNCRGRNGMRVLNGTRGGPSGIIKGRVSVKGRMIFKTTVGNLLFNKSRYREELIFQKKNDNVSFVLSVKC